MSPLAIRPATAVDLPRLHGLIERAYRGEPARAGWTHEADLLRGPRTDLPTLAALIADPANTMLIAEEDGAIVACIQVSDKGDHAYLGQLAVEPVRQAAGLGRAMLAAAASHARGFGATRVEMTVIAGRTELVAYYERRGFTATGEVRPFPFEAPISGPPLHLVVLERRLEPDLLHARSM